MRDPDARLGGQVPRPQVDSDLPGDAVATGFANASGISLWLADSTPDMAYLVQESGQVEAWPRANPVIGCDQQTDRATHVQPPSAASRHVP